MAADENRIDNEVEEVLDKEFGEDVSNLKELSIFLKNKERYGEILSCQVCF